MRVRIFNYRPKEEIAFIRGMRFLARFNVRLDHFKIFNVNLMECSSRGYLIWSPPGIQISAHGRKEILRKVKEEMELAKAPEGA